MFLKKLNKLSPILTKNIYKFDKYNLSNFKSFTTCTEYGLNKMGITEPKKIKYNLSYEELFNDEVKNNEGVVFDTKYGKTFGIDTGEFTGRSPKDKWIVKNIDSKSAKNIWWGNVNQEIRGETFDNILKIAQEHFNSLDSLYLFDGYCGSSVKSRKKVRFVHELAWQQHFVKNMFISSNNDLCDISKLDIRNNEPDFTIINACSAIYKNWEEDGLNSEITIAFNIEEKIGVILGTWYGGENKKGIFSLMNYWLPLQNIMTMHCSANIGKNGDTALFFGLSGTGKTTLSVDPKRYIIGDDEHGWDEDGIFNLEGGCYAKTIDLKEENEPDIYKSIRKNALLENVYKNNDDTPDYSNIDKTQNGRVSFPINHIDNCHPTQQGSHPKNIIFLTCDAFGILPPIAKLSTGQAMYHFLSGYTAKVAGTERGIEEPEATFSACFGEAFLMLHPTIYADLLKQKIEAHNCNVYLVNTGWVGGRYGVGERISIQDTRKCIDSVLDGTIEDCTFYKNEVFGFDVPENISNMQNIFKPEQLWENKQEYIIEEKKLALMFNNNYKKYIDKDYTDYSKYGPNIL